MPLIKPRTNRVRLVRHMRLLQKPNRDALVQSRLQAVAPMLGARADAFEFLVVDQAQSRSPFAKPKGDQQDIVGVCPPSSQEWVVTVGCSFGVDSNSARGRAAFVSRREFPSDNETADGRRNS